MIRVFPVAGEPTFRSEFGPSHHGIDIFASAGTDVLAVDNGDARSSVESRGGNAVYLRASDGVTYYYGHLQEFVGRFPRSVRAGEVIGRVGTTGNAEGTSPHVHFEIHESGEAVDPFPELSRLHGAASGGAPTLRPKGEPHGD